MVNSMKKELGESLSAMIDGELDARSRKQTTDELIDNANVRQAWQRYHLVRDTLTKNLPDVVAPGLFDRVCDAIAQEPAHKIESAVKARKNPLLGFWLQPAYGFVAAAALVVAVVTVTQIERSVSELPPLAQLDVMSSGQQVGNAEISLTATEKVSPASQAQLSTYLANHTARSRSYPMHDGLLHYVRSVEFRGER